MSKSKITYKEIRGIIDGLAERDSMCAVKIAVCDAVMKNIGASHYPNDKSFEDLCEAILIFWLKNGGNADFDEFAYEMQRVQEDFIDAGQNCKITSEEVMSEAWEQAKDIMRSRLG